MGDDAEEMKSEQVENADDKMSTQEMAAGIDKLESSVDTLESNLD